MVLIVEWQRRVVAVHGVVAIIIFPTRKGYVCFVRQPEGKFEAYTMYWRLVTYDTFQVEFWWHLNNAEGRRSRSQIVQKMLIYPFCFLYPVFKVKCEWYYHSSHAVKNRSLFLVLTKGILPCKMGYALNMSFVQYVHIECQPIEVLAWQSTSNWMRMRDGNIHWI